VNALRHAVRDDLVAHAYLFSGPRGTGKTSTARILAKALNCRSPVDGEPCGICESCVDITRGASFDVHELDAASNNGVDAMRDLVSRASLATPGRWKVYIVDEVHMLSQAASNALLKTLEEPPDHVVFVLATTDPQKVLPTIRSRTQHYEFHLLDTDVLAALLADVVSDARLELPDTAVDAAVRRGRGSARDALSALDQVVASGVVEDDSPFLHELLASLAERDTQRALRAVEAAHVAGRDAPRIAAELLDELRGQFLAALAPGLAREGQPGVPAPPEPPGSQPASSNQSTRGGLVLLLGPARTVRAMEVLGAAMVAMRDALDARITLEVAIVRLTHPEADDDPAALLERIERLERRVHELSHGVAAVAVPPAPPPSPPPPPPAHLAAPAQTQPPPPAPPMGPTSSRAATSTTSKAPAQQGSLRAGIDALESQPSLGAFGPSRVASEPTRPAGASSIATPAPQPAATPVTGPEPDNDLPPPTRDELVAAWGDHVLSQLRPRVRAVFAVGRFVATEGATAIVALPNSAHVQRAEPDSQEVAEALGRYFGRRVGVRLVAESEVGGASSPAAHASSAGRVGESVDNGHGPKTTTPAPGPGSATTPAAAARPATTAAGVTPATTPSAPVETAAAPASGPAKARVAPGASGDLVADEILDPNDLDPYAEQVVTDPVSWAQDRLMEAFPGAEEV